MGTWEFIMLFSLLLCTLGTVLLKKIIIAKSLLRWVEGRTPWVVDLASLHLYPSSQVSLYFSHTGFLTAAKHTQLTSTSGRDHKMSTKIWVI